MKYEELVSVLKEADEKTGKQFIAKYISQDENIIPMLIAILAEEREFKKELISEMNLNLTRNTTGLMYPQIIPAGSVKKQTEFYINETKKFYKKYEDSVKTAGLKLWDDIK